MKDILIRTSQDVERLCKLTERLVQRYGISASALREERILSVYGNMNFDEERITLDEVRRVFDLTDTAESVTLDHG